jgi:hypothetical protein
MQGMDNERLRAEIAWLLWCATQGYIKAEDRQELDNWFLSGSVATDHPDDDREEAYLAAENIIADWIYRIDLLHLETDLSAVEVLRKIQDELGEIKA